MYRRCGVHGVIVENMHDVPYLQNRAGSEVTACMTKVASEVRRVTEDMILGIQILSCEQFNQAHDNMPSKMCIPVSGPYQIQELPVIKWEHLSLPPQVGGARLSTAEVSSDSHSKPLIKGCFRKLQEVKTWK